MKILFIGYSNLFKKRILPILDDLKFIDSVCIAKFIDQSWDDSYKSITKPVQLYNNYQDAINNTDVSIAYITTTNNSHYFWAKTALNAGLHTIIDKPATVHFTETEELINIAQRKGLLLSESTVYTYHPQLLIIDDIIKQYNSSPKLLTAHFSFPLSDVNNFRYSKELGGGAFLDTGSYAVSIGRYFFDSLPEACYYLENEVLENGLEISYSLLLKYSNGRALVGHFGFDTEYINRLNILGDRICIDIDRIFTIPDSISNKITVRVNNQIFEVIAPSGNSFELYFEVVGTSIENNSFNKFYKEMHMDAFARDIVFNSNRKN